LMASEHVRMVVVLECRNVMCYHQSDYNTPLNGRPWMGICLLAAVGQMPRIDQNGKCSAMEAWSP